MSLVGTAFYNRRDGSQKEGMSNSPKAMNQITDRLKRLTWIPYLLAHKAVSIRSQCLSLKEQASARLRGMLQSKQYFK